MICIIDNLILFLLMDIINNSFLLSVVFNIALFFLIKQVFIIKSLFKFKDIEEMRYYCLSQLAINIYQISGCCIMCILVFINTKIFVEFYVIYLAITLLVQNTTQRFTLDMFQKSLGLICSLQFYIFEKYSYSNYQLFGTILWSIILYHDVLEIIFGKIIVNLEKSIQQSLPTNKLKIIRLILFPVLIAVIIADIYHGISNWNIFENTVNNIIYRICVLLIIGAKVLKSVNYYDISFYEYKTRSNTDNNDSSKLYTDYQDVSILCPDDNQDSLNKRHHINGNYGRYSRRRPIKTNDNCCNFV